MLSLEISPPSQGCPRISYNESMIHPALTKKRFGSVQALIPIFCQAGVIYSPAVAEPSSGYLETRTTTAGKTRVDGGRKYSERTWFHGNNTRTENLVGDEITTISVSGDQSWTACPTSGRVFMLPPGSVALTSYPERLRTSFSLNFAARRRVGTVTFDGLTFWKYAWHQPEHTTGCLVSPAHNVAYLVFADKDLPFSLPCDLAGTGMRTHIDLRLNTPVSPDRFQPPPHLKPVRPFTWKATRFTVTFESNRVSTQYGWKTHSVETFHGDGEKITRTFTSLQTDLKGAQTALSATPEALTLSKVSAELANRFQQPPWSGVRLVGHETILNQPADVLAGDPDTQPREKWSVTDHPALGTVCLHHRTEYSGDMTDTVVTRLDLEPVK